MPKLSIHSRPCHFGRASCHCCTNKKSRLPALQLSSPPSEERRINVSICRCISSAVVNQRATTTFMHVKVTNRVSGSNFPDDNPLCDSVMELDNYKVIPTGPDHISQRGNHIRLMERVLTEKIPYLSFCKDVTSLSAMERTCQQNQKR